MKRYAQRSAMALSRICSLRGVITKSWNKSRGRRRSDSRTMTTIVGIFDNARDLDKAIERLARAAFQDTVYDEAIVRGRARWRPSGRLCAGLWSAGGMGQQCRTRVIAT